MPNGSSRRRWLRVKQDSRCPSLIVRSRMSHSSPRAVYTRTAGSAECHGAAPDGACDLASKGPTKMHHNSATAGRPQPRGDARLRGVAMSDVRNLSFVANSDRRISASLRDGKLLLGQELDVLLHPAPRSVQAV